MSRESKSLIGSPVDLGTTLKTVGVLSALPYESVRVVLHNWGGDGNIDSCRVEGSSDPEAETDVTLEDQGWVTLATISDFMPTTGDFSFETSRYVDVEGPWALLRIAALKPSASPAVATQARCDFIATPWIE